MAPLLNTVLLLRASVPLLRMPPPEPPFAAPQPRVMVRPLRLTVAPWATSNTREVSLALTDSWPVLGPWIVTLLASASWPLESVIVLGTIGGGGTGGGGGVGLPWPLALPVTFV